MLRGKRLIIVIAFFFTQKSVACENSNHINGDSSRRLTGPIAPPSIDDDDNDPANQQNGKFATYTYDIPPGLILPIHLLIDEDENKPASEPFVDYSVYKVGAQWPDWDWSDPVTVRKEEKIITQRNAPWPYLPSITQWLLLTCFFCVCVKKT